jgi:hypothetical protein
MSLRNLLWGNKWVDEDNPDESYEQRLDREREQREAFEAKFPEDVKDVKRRDASDSRRRTRSIDRY